MHAHKNESSQWESAEQLAGTYMEQVEDSKDTMKALSAGCSSAWVDIHQSVVYYTVVSWD